MTDWAAEPYGVSDPLPGLNARITRVIRLAHAPPRNRPSDLAQSGGKFSSARAGTAPPWALELA